ncbi:unnamed protein product [Darwinula stevensoni]|uniref:Uncharacterized protein n=1 Tax=Darwinula stevensoni TaxID=69355 RepID=A0A7R9A2T8_9CRUS|nr:unnamed protein product [Darwinula stevensoni]CAG0880166.1 unnamed protein product [Darwinula stevensoni]
MPISATAIRWNSEYRVSRVGETVDIASSTITSYPVLLLFRESGDTLSIRIPSNACYLHGSTDREYQRCLIMSGSEEEEADDPVVAEYVGEGVAKRTFECVFLYNMITTNDKY